MNKKKRYSVTMLVETEVEVTIDAINKTQAEEIADSAILAGHYYIPEKFYHRKNKHELEGSESAFATTKVISVESENDT